MQTAARYVPRKSRTPASRTVTRADGVTVSTRVSVGADAHDASSAIAAPQAAVIASFRAWCEERLNPLFTKRILPVAYAMPPVNGRHLLLHRPGRHVVRNRISRGNKLCPGAPLTALKTGSPRPCTAQKRDPEFSDNRRVARLPDKLDR
jgi:hypothetical protein